MKRKEAGRKKGRKTLRDRKRERLDLLNFDNLRRASCRVCVCDSMRNTHTHTHTHTFTHTQASANYADDKQSIKRGD
jgi:hypothetical protein